MANKYFDSKLKIFFALNSNKPLAQKKLPMKLGLNLVKRPLTVLATVKFGLTLKKVFVVVTSTSFSQHQHPLTIT